MSPVAPPPPHSAIENAQVAVKQWFDNAAKALSNAFTGNKKPRLRYADLGKRDDEHTPEEYPLFDPQEHKKYFAHMYFQSSQDSEIPSSDAEKQEKRMAKNVLQTMADPVRSAKAQEAYDDFLRGLEMINQQEYLKNEFCGEGWTDDKIRAASDEVLFTAVDLENGKSKKEYDSDVLFDKAQWERAVMLRRHAKTARSFYEQLKARAQAPNTDKPEAWLNYDEKNDGPKRPLRRPPIRWKTFEMLTRPLEADWNIGLFLSWLFTIVTYIVALVTQCIAIAEMCSGGYICPVRDVQVPLMAPPVQFRQPQTNAVWYKSRFGPTWDPQVSTTCTIDETGCDDPGYKIQWPYIQVDSTSLSAELPIELTDKCTLRQNEDNFWLWDPFSRSLLNTYLECSTEVSDTITFSHDGISFHFDPGWYDDAMEKTRECMQDSADKYGISNFNNWEGTDDEDEFLEAIELCVGSDSGLQDKANMCKCSTSLPNFPIRHFYAGNDPIKTCDGGPFDDNLCDDDDNCGDSEPSTCSIRFDKDHHSLASSPLFGCFFEEPWAVSREQPRYHICGMTLESKTDAAGNLKSKLQRAVTPNIISKKAGLMITFVVKEASYLTGFFVLFVVIVVGTVVLLPVIIVYNIFHSRWGKGDLFQVWNSRLMQFKDMVGSIIWVQILTLWSTCVNFSTTYRMIKFAISLGTGHVNMSIHDLDKKLTGVANLMFNLVLLVFQDDVSTGIYLSLALSLALLLYQMNAEKQGLKGVADVLKDINEMRLSKFEMALGMTKVMEDILEYDVEYNWVAHFYNEQPLYPLEAHPNFTSEDYHPGKSSRDLHYEENHTLRFMPLMDVERARRWGHDGRGKFDETYQTDDDKKALEGIPENPNLELVFVQRPTEGKEIERLVSPHPHESYHNARALPLGNIKKPQARGGINVAAAGTTSSSNGAAGHPQHTPPPQQHPQMIGGFQYNMPGMPGAAGPAMFNPYGAQGYGGGFAPFM